MMQCECVVHNDVYNNINKRIYRWSSTTNQFTNPIVMSASIYNDFGESRVMTYSAEHNRIYIGYSSGVVSRFTLDELSEVAFASLGRSINGIGSAGDFILVENENGAWNTHYIIDEFGEITDSKDWNTSSASYVWNEAEFILLNMVTFIIKLSIKHLDILRERVIFTVVLVLLIL